MIDELMSKFQKFLDSKLAENPTHVSRETSHSGQTSSHTFSHAEDDFLNEDSTSQTFSRTSDGFPDEDSTSETFSHDSTWAEKSEPTPPRTLPEFIDMIKHTPKSVLSATDRGRIAAVMSFDERTVGDLMVPKKEMIFVKENEVLGPLMLDKLYKSGFTNFPVVNRDNKVLGVLHTEALNALEIKETDRASKHIDPIVNYLNPHDSLQDAVEEIGRTNGYYFLVQDDFDQLVGFFTAKMLLDYLLDN